MSTGAELSAYLSSTTTRTGLPLGIAQIAAWNPLARPHGRCPGWLRP